MTHLHALDDVERRARYHVIIPEFPEDPLFEHQQRRRFREGRHFAPQLTL